MSFMDKARGLFGKKPQPEVAPPPAPTASVGHVEFEQLEPHQLKQVAVVAQALDNQWVPRHLLRRMLKSRGLQGLRDVEAQLKPLVRAEYIRALLTSEQVVINRAYFANSATLRQDHMPGSTNRLAFRGLLAEGVIVPNLLYERSPDEPPQFEVHGEGFASWQRMCEEVRTSCVRFSWDSAVFDQKYKAMDQRFGMYVQSLSRIADQGDFERLCGDLGVPAEAQERFRDQLEEVSVWCARQRGGVRRNDVYKEFVVAPKSNPVDGLYDPSKPFSAEIKQLSDLSYATNLPDALGRYALTPIDSLPRTALQEVTVRYGAPPSIVTAADLKRLLQREVFARITTVLAGEEGFLNSLHHLSLAEVQTIRSSDEWHAYIVTVQALLDQPLSFETRAGTVVDRYIALARTITRVSADARAAHNLERWHPVITLAINIGGAVINATVNPFGPELPGQIVYNFLGNVAQDAAQVVARLIIGGVANRSAQARLENSIDFMRAQLPGAQHAWGELKEQILSGGNAKAPDAQGASADDMYDPNLNFSEDIVAVGATA